MVVMALRRGRWKLGGYDTDDVCASVVHVSFFLSLFLFSCTGGVREDEPRAEHDKSYV